MGLFVTLHNTTSQYESVESSLIKPHIALTEDDNKVHYKPSVKLITTFYVTNTSSPTRIGYNEYISGFSSIEIDGVVQSNVVSSYTFSTTGVHNVIYELTNPTAISSYAFYNVTNLYTIIIPNVVNTIGEYAFYNCTYLEDVTLPTSLNLISHHCFTNCTSLNSPNIPNCVIGIGAAAFSGCTFDAITIPNSVKTIGIQAFNCRNVTNITIGTGITNIYDSAFASDYLESVTIYATTPPTIGENTPFPPMGWAGEYPIYVPSGSVNAYKTAWASIGSGQYSNVVQAIP